MKTKKKVFIVEDHAIFREGLKRVIGEMDDVELVGEAENGAVFLEKLKKVSPDIVLMDIDISGLPTMGPVRQIRRDQPGVKIILWSIDPLPPRVREIVKASVNGYLLKDADPEVLLAAVRTVAVGGTYMSAESNGRPQGHFKQGT